MGSIFGGGGGGAKTVNPPLPLKINAGQMENQMVGADQAAYNAADQYLTKYYPALATGRDQSISQAFDALTGPLNPSLENTFVNEGNMGAINALGGGDQSFGTGGGPANAGGDSSWGGSGSLARKSAAASVASSEQGYQDYQRNLFEQLNTMFAPRSFGMTPEDAANIFTFNNTQMNNYLQQKFGAQTNAFYQNEGLSAQAGAAGTSAVAGLSSAVIGGLLAL